MTYTITFISEFLDSDPNTVLVIAIAQKTIVPGRETGPSHPQQGWYTIQSELGLQRNTQARTCLTSMLVKHLTVPGKPRNWEEDAQHCWQGSYCCHGTRYGTEGSGQAWPFYSLTLWLGAMYP